MSEPNSSREGRQAPWSSLAVTLYRSSRNSKLRGVIRSMVLRAENGPVYSRTIRQIYREFHGVDVGLYSIGPCDVPPGNLAPGTSVGRYSSIYYTVRTITTQDPAKTLSTHRLFSPEALGSATSCNGPRESIAIGHDVWMGHNVIILPTAQSIGDGAIVGAGSVVHNPVPPYAVVTGNPARVVRFRFPEKVIQELMESKWWLKSIEELKTRLEDFRKPLDGSGVVR